MNQLTYDIVQYMNKTGRVTPGGKDGAIFLATEVGDLLDAIMRREQEWVRNNETIGDLKQHIQDEIGDCLMMVHLTALALGVDPEVALRAKMNRKMQQCQ